MKGFSNGIEKKKASVTVLGGVYAWRDSEGYACISTTKPSFMHNEEENNAGGITYTFPETAQYSSAENNAGGLTIQFAEGTI